MTISLRGSATGLSAGVTTTLAFTLPTGVTTNDCMIAFYGGKPYTMALSSGTLSTDYTDVGSTTNGTTANNVDLGSVYADMAYRIHSGTESAPTGTLSATPSPRISGMIALQSTVSGSGWTVTGTTASDATATGTTFSATGAASLSVQTGDWIVVLVMHNTDAMTHTSASLTLSGATISGLTQQLGTTTTNQGNDGAMYLYTAQVTGTATAAPVFSVTTPTGISDGAVVFGAIREPVAAATSIQSWGTVSI